VTALKLEIGHDMPEIGLRMYHAAPYSALHLMKYRIDRLYSLTFAAGKIVKRCIAFFIGIEGIGKTEATVKGV